MPPNSSPPSAARADTFRQPARSGSLRVFLALEPCDMRKSFDGLHAEVINRLGDDPRSGAVFVFTNKSRNLLKLPHWDGTGLWVHAKRLERGTYRWPKPGDAKNGKLVHGGLLGSGNLQADETPIKYLDPGKGKTSTGYLWVIHAPCAGIKGDILYQWHPSRKAACLDELPGNYHGNLQTDA